MTLDQIRAAFAAGLEVPEEDVMVQISEEYPECVCGVVLQDVNPQNMNKVSQVLADAGFRICINVVEADLAHRLRGLGFDTAFEESWMLAVATVRSEL